MDAEQIRDSLLTVSAPWKETVRPSANLTPDFKRRTVYGKVSRYIWMTIWHCSISPVRTSPPKSDLPPTYRCSALFFMNSDFVQDSRTAPKGSRKKPANTARIQKVYKLVFGAATPEEVQVE